MICDGLGFNAVAVDDMFAASNAVCHTFVTKIAMIACSAYKNFAGNLDAKYSMTRSGWTGFNGDYIAIHQSSR